MLSSLFFCSFFFNNDCFPPVGIRIRSQGIHFRWPNIMGLCLDIKPLQPRLACDFWGTTLEATSKTAFCKQKTPISGSKPIGKKCRFRLRMYSLEQVWHLKPQCCCSAGMNAQAFSRCCKLENQMLNWQSQLFKAGRAHTNVGAFNPSPRNQLPFRNVFFKFAKSSRKTGIVCPSPVERFHPCVSAVFNSPAFFSFFFYERHPTFHFCFLWPSGVLNSSPHIPLWSRPRAQWQLLSHYENLPRSVRLHFFFISR